MKVWILGMGSKECVDLQVQLTKLLQEIHSTATLGISDDIDLFIKYKIKKTPALLVNNVIIPNNELRDLNHIRHVLEEEDEHDDNNQDLE